METEYAEFPKAWKATTSIEISKVNSMSKYESRY